MSSLMIIFVLCICFELTTGEHTLSEQCPGMVQCDEPSRDTLDMLGRSKLDCGKYECYLACLDAKLSDCTLHSHQPQVSMATQTPTEASDPGSTLTPPDQPEETSRNDTDHHVDNTTYHIDPLADIKEVTSSLCANDTGVLDIPANVSKLLAQHYDKSEDKYASFPDYNYIHQNLSMRTGCEDMANCSLILEPYNKVDTSYFPCPALVEFQECFDYNEDGCQGDDLAALTSSVQAISSECPVDSATGLEASMMLLMTSLILAVWN